MTRVGSPWRRGVFDLQGHRGAQGHVVENTLPSFLKAVELGVTSVEFDVRLTADGVPVVWHDPVLRADKCRAERPGLVGARVDELTLDQLAEVDVGRPQAGAFPGQESVPGTAILALTELFARLSEVAPELRYVVEVKVDPTDAAEVRTRAELVRAVLAAVATTGVADRAVMHSFDWEVLRLSADLAPELPRSALAISRETFAPGSAWVGESTYDDAGGDLPLAVSRLGAVVVAPLFALRDGTRGTDGRAALVTDAAFVERAHGLGLAVVPWTVDEPEDLARVLATGVDGLVTDYPDRVDTREIPVW